MQPLARVDTAQVGASTGILGTPEHLAAVEGVLVGLI